MENYHQLMLQLNCSDHLINYTNQTSIPKQTAVTTILSSLFSIIGSLLIIVTFVAFREVRTAGRAILVFLAVADFFTAAGYIFGSAVFLKYYDALSFNDSSYLPLCEIQSFITTAFPISSFLWTMNLAVYLFVAIVLRKVQLAKKLMIVFHIIGWGIPLLVCIPAVATGVLGPAESHSSASWCWVRFDQSQPSKLSEFYLMEVVCGKFWEIMTYFVALLLCGIVKYTISKRKRRFMSESATTYGYSSLEKRMKEVFYHVDQKLLWIPFVFLLVRMWGTLRFFISTSPSCHYTVCDKEVVVLPECYNVLYHPLLVYLQSIGDPGQGWSNALLFVIFHQPIAERLFPCCFVCWRRCFKRCISGFLFCRIRRKPPVEESSSSTAHTTPNNSRDSHYHDHDPLVIKTKMKKSGSKTSYDENSVLYYSVESSPNPKVVLPPDKTSINEQMESTD